MLSLFSPHWPPNLIQSRGDQRYRHRSYVGAAINKSSQRIHPWLQAICPE